MSTLPIQQFCPTSRVNHQVGLKPNQRYRNPFGDLRLSRTAKRTISRLVSKRVSTVAGCTRSRNERAAIYRFLSNDKVTLEELIHFVTDLSGKKLRDKDLYILVDASVININLGPKHHGSRKDWPARFGVINDNASPGFSVMPSLVKDGERGHILGLGDILVHARKQVKGTKKQKRAAGKQREKLSLEQKETGAWSIVASGSSTQLAAARRVTYIMDQGGDDYCSLATLVDQTGHDFIVRSKHDRQARRLGSDEEVRLEYLLSQQPVVSSCSVPIKPLNHYSKTASKIVQRQKRKALLHMKMAEVVISPPCGLHKLSPILTKSLWVIEVAEDPSTVPEGEAPIRWKLLTSWRIEGVGDALKVVKAYQQRWDVEQLFRVLKKQGFNVEQTQLNHPDRIKKLVVMALAASVIALQLVAARDGKNARSADEVFSPQEITTMKTMQVVLNGNTEKTQNPHSEESLAWAAWIIARAGGWSGYESQKPPGPIIMTRGLRELEVLTAYQVPENDT